MLEGITHDDDSITCGNDYQYAEAIWLRARKMLGRMFGRKAASFVPGCAMSAQSTISTASA